MPQDALYRAPRNPIELEAFQDPLYEEPRNITPTSREYYDGRPVSPHVNSIMDEILGKDGFFKSAIAKDDLMISFDYVKRDPKFKDFSVVDYMSFDLLFEGVMSGPMPTVLVQNMPTILVENNFKIGMINPNAVSKAYLFVPFEHLNIQRYEQFALANQVRITNHSNPLLNSVSSGKFRVPIAITKNTSHARFDSYNTEVYNNDWFIIKLSIPASHFVNK